MFLGYTHNQSMTESTNMLVFLGSSIINYQNPINICSLPMNNLDSKYLEKNKNFSCKKFIKQTLKEFISSLIDSVLMQW